MKTKQTHATLAAQRNQERRRYGDAPRERDRTDHRRARATIRQLKKV